MRRIRHGLAWAVAALVVAPAGAQTAPSAMTAVAPAGQMQFDIASRITGRTYRIFVQRPLLPAPAKGWPVITVTDGNGTFAAAASAERLGELAGRSAVVVGVGYPEGVAASLQLRNRDLTPPTPPEGLPVRPGQPKPKPEDYGGSALFYRFLVEELRPQIAASLAVDPDRQTLYGHSFGGLFTLGVLFAHPEAFSRFVISSPSIWWNGRAVLAGGAEFAKRIEAKVVAPEILVLVGGLEQEVRLDKLPPGFARADAEKLVEETRMVDNARELATRLAALKGGPGYRVRFQAFVDEDHISVVPASLGRAIPFAEEAPR